VKYQVLLILFVDGLLFKLLNWVKKMLQLKYQVINLQKRTLQSKNVLDMKKER